MSRLFRINAAALMFLLFCSCMMAQSSPPVISCTGSNWSGTHWQTCVVESTNIPYFCSVNPSCNNSTQWIGFSNGGGTGSVTSVTCGTFGASWLSCSFGSSTTVTPILALSATAAQTSHKVIGTCDSGTTFAPCSLVLADLPSALFTLTTTGTSGASTYSGSTLNIPQYVGPTTNQNIRTIGSSFGDFSSGASAILGSQISCVPTYFSGTIVAVELIATPSGSVTVDVKTVAHGSFTGPASTSSITASDIPALSSGTTYADTTLTGWTTSFSAGTDVCFYLTSPTTVTGVAISVKVGAN